MDFGATSEATFEGDLSEICSAFLAGAPEGIRTPNLLIRSQMLYPLSYGRLGISCNLVQPTGLAIPAPN